MIIKASADSNLKGVHLELGGKSPMVVCADADLENALNMVVDGAFRNSAQNCCCGSRLFVEESIYDSFLEKLVERTNKLVVGKFDVKDVFIGPLINEKQYKNCLTFIQHGMEVEKLKLATGGIENFDKGYFVRPTIFSHVPDDSKLAREEIFAPVLVVLKPFKSFKEVVERCNDTKYGLASGVFTKDMNKAEYFVRNIESGTVWVNMYNLTNYNISFGGFKQSGFGRDNGQEAIFEYTHTKAVYHKNDLSSIN